MSRTAKVSEAQELQRVQELHELQRLTIGRELTMIELKGEIEHLRKLASPRGTGTAEDPR